VKVYIPTPMRSYTNKQSVVEAEGPTVGAVLEKIERRYPGFRFRIIDEQGGIRQHIKIFVNETPIRNLEAAAEPGDAVHIVCALSGGI
jgi:molybdopterin synthase sulfur carrier subunit